MNIIKLLRIEFQKIQSYFPFWILMGLYLLILFVIFSISGGYFEDTFGEASTEQLSPLAFPNVWQNISWFVSYMDIFPIMISIILFGNEFSYRTSRQNIIDGLSRGEFLVSKILGNFILSFIATLVVALGILMIGLVNSEDTSNMFKNVEFILAFWVQLWGYLCFALLLTLLIRRTGFTIVLFFGYLFIERLFIVLPLPAPYEDYLFLEALHVTLTSPFEGMTIENVEFSTKLNYFNTIKGFIYSIFYLGLGFYLLEKRDL